MSTQREDERALRTSISDAVRGGSVAANSQALSRYRREQRLPRLTAALLLAAGLSSLTGSPVQAKASWMPRALRTRGPVTVRGFRRLVAVDLPNPTDPGLVASVGRGVLRVNGRTVARHIGPVLWSNDGSILFYAPAPPPTAPSTAEPVYGLQPGKAPKHVGIASDPWTTAATGPSGVAIDAGGRLTIAGLTSRPVRTGIELVPWGYPYADSAFLPSPNGRYVAVAGPHNSLTMDTITRSGRVLSRQRLPGRVPGNRYNWGAWAGDSSAFVFSTRNGYTGTHRLWCWHAASGRITNISAGLARLTASGQFLVLGFLRPLPGDFLAEALSLGAPLTGTYAVVNERGAVVQALWTGGMSGTVLPDGSVQFTVSPASGAPISEQADLSFTRAKP